VDHIGHLGIEIGVGAELEGLNPMGLQSVLAPDAPNCCSADPHLLGKSAGAPVRPPNGRAHRLSNDLVFLILSDLPLTASSMVKSAKTSKSTTPQSLPPRANRLLGTAKAMSPCSHGFAIGTA